MSEASEVDEAERARKRGLVLYLCVALCFVALVLAGVYTVVLPELRDDPEQRAPDAGAPH